MEKRKDITGYRFGNWTVIKFVRMTLNRDDRYLCKCDCGTEKELYGYALRNGKTKNCRRCMRNTGNFKHGFTRKEGRNDPTWTSWQAMIIRCTYPKTNGYKNYGGRGITIDPDWLGSEGFEHFLRDMGERPKGKTLERIDNDGSYSKVNCKWATREEQSKNMRRSRLIAHKGNLFTMRNLAEELNVNYNTLCARRYNGWSDEEIINTPVGEKRA